MIEFAGNTTPYGSGCIQTFSAQPMLRNNTIRYGSSIAIQAIDMLLAQTLSGRLTVQSNWIHDHSVGIQLNLEGALIENNYLINNTQAIVMRTSSNDMVIRNNTIVNPKPDVPGDCINLSMDAAEDDNGISAYLWEQTGGVEIELEDPNSPYGAFTAPEVDESVETLIFDLTVTDDDGLQRTESVEILVIGTNDPPVADAGSNIAAETSEEGVVDIEVQLSASGSFDPDKGIIEYQWTQTAGTQVDLSDAAAIDPTFITPDITAVPTWEILTFEVTVTDTEFLEATDTVDVLVFTNNIPPVANAGTDYYVYQETEVRLDGTDSFDQDGSIAAYDWIQTAGRPVVLENANTSRPTFLVPDVGETE